MKLFRIRIEAVMNESDAGLLEKNKYLANDSENQLNVGVEGVVAGGRALNQYFSQLNSHYFGAGNQSTSSESYLNPSSYYYNFMDHQQQSTTQSSSLSSSFAGNLLSIFFKLS